MKDIENTEAEVQSCLGIHGGTRVCRRGSFSVDLIPEGDRFAVKARIDSSRGAISVSRIHEATEPIEDIAAGLLRACRDEILRCHDPDPNMHKCVWTRHEWSSRGRDFMSILDEAESLPPVLRLLNEITVSSGAERALRRTAIAGNQELFYVAQDGSLQVGHGPDQTSLRSSYIQINPEDRQLSVKNIEPTTKLFKRLVATIARFIPDIADWDCTPFNLSHPSPGPRPDYNRYRKVAYYIAQDATDVTRGRVPRSLYHGTSTELWFDGISRIGLVPRDGGGLGAAGSYGAIISHADKVYLSVHPDAACRSAAYQSSQKHGGFPMILRINTDGLFGEKFTGDEDAEDRYKSDMRRRKGLRDPGFASTSVSSMGTLAYAGKVPVSLIQPFLVAKMEGFKIFKWVRWDENTPRTDHAMTSSLNDPARWSDYRRSPNFYALQDAGLVDPKSGEPTRQVSDEEVRKIIKSSPWASDCKSIVKQISEWGAYGIKSLHYVKFGEIQEPELKLIAHLLISSGLYYLNNGTMQLRDVDAAVQQCIAFSKSLREHGLDLQQVMKLLPGFSKYV